MTITRRQFVQKTRSVWRRRINVLNAKIRCHVSKRENRNGAVGMPSNFRTPVPLQIVGIYERKTLLRCLSRRNRRVRNRYERIRRPFRQETSMESKITCRTYAKRANLPATVLVFRICYYSFLFASSIFDLPYSTSSRSKYDFFCSF